MFIPVEKVEEDRQHTWQRTYVGPKINTVRRSSFSDARSTVDKIIHDPIFSRISTTFTCALVVEKLPENGILTGPGYGLV